MPRGRPRKDATPSVPEAPKPTLTVVENAHDKFRRIANQRQRVLREAMMRMGRLGRYEGTPEEVERLIEVLNRDFSFMIEQLRHGTASEIEDVL